MTVSEYERFAVRRPLRDADYSSARGRREPPLTFLSARQIPETTTYVELSWINNMPATSLCLPERVLDHDQVLLHIGMDYRTPQSLGGTIELNLGGQPIVFNTTTAVFIPKGTLYGPLTWREFRHPHVQMSIVFGSGDPYSGRGVGDAGATGNTVSRKTAEFDYEQYVVRSPLREAGPDYVEGRQNPTMTYMSGVQVPGVENYIEVGWIWDVPSRAIPRMRHDNFDEVVVHLGSDPNDPEDLGATMRFDIGDDLLEFDTTHCVFLPRGLNHGPLSWMEVQRPMIEIAMMLGAGTWAEGWEGSFFDE